MQKQNKDVVIDLAKLVIIQNEDEVLDFINTLEVNVKETMLEKLDSPSSKDLAIFFTSTSKNSPDDIYYIVLIKIISAGEEENGLLLAYSEDINVVSFFLTESSDLTFEQAKNGFSKNDF